MNLPHDLIRTRLADLIRRRGEEAAGLSRLIGRPAGYVSGYLRGSPKRLRDEECGTLAAYFWVHEDDLLPRTLRAARVEAMGRRA